MEVLETMLREAGIRPTSIRLLVLRQIMSLDNAFTLADAEMFLETVDRSTLFRTLTLFLMRGILHEVDNGSGSKLYCLCTGGDGNASDAHIHFTCRQCGRTFCIKDIDAMNVPRPKGFVVDEVSCVMKGVCPDCQ